jgi:hypothetical protein
MLALLDQIEYSARHIESQQQTSMGIIPDRPVLSLVGCVRALEVIVRNLALKGECRSAWESHSRGPHRHGKEPKP